jgi:DNA-3-methyladenine glycosylase
MVRATNKRWGETHFEKLPRRFYRRPTLTVARELPGKYLLRRRGRSLLIARLVEVEAYLGARDPASHAFRGLTARNEVMFGDGGFLYVYFTYGMHFCCNVVTESAGKAGAVLLRAAEPLAGRELMMTHRSSGQKRALRVEDLCSGPGKLCQALSIGREDNGMDLCGDRIWIAQSRVEAPPLQISRSPRIGITNGQEHLWRFFIRDSPSLSRRAHSSRFRERRGR